MTPRLRPEHEFHQVVAGFLDLALPPDAWWTSIGHGAYLGGGEVVRRGRRVSLASLRGATLKSIGVKPGVPDVLVVRSRPAASLNLWLELKSADGRLSKDQEEVRDVFSRMEGWHWAVARTLEEVEAVLLSHHVPLRARVSDGRILSPLGSRLHTGKSRHAVPAPRVSARARRAAAELYAPDRKPTR